MNEDEQIVYIKHTGKLVSMQEFAKLFKAHIIPHLELYSMCVRITKLVADEKIFKVL